MEISYEIRCGYNPEHLLLRVFIGKRNGAGEKALTSATTTATTAMCGDVCMKIFVIKTPNKVITKFSVTFHKEMRIVLCIWNIHIRVYYYINVCVCV